ncbi:KilA-N domain-containing protein [Syntrophus gentianae]|uniref:KilA-N domain-containing protein n=1 Tax=Syntrophus gentianae TaxID=43775 RepID=A0A1H7UWV6_9BACT|nr:KilA-N domain-containing protein [Syntrophus gentianae]SEM01491.1 KilA-N domain-containing protein [Syntrophus gentianae]
MGKSSKTTIEVQGTAITVLSQKEKYFICLTDIARVKNSDRSDDLVRNWIRNRNTVEFLSIWEKLNNPDFNSVEFDGIKMLAGLNSPQSDRLKRLNEIAIRQMQILTATPALKQIKE